MERKVSDPERVIAQLAAPQRGLVTRNQLDEAGFSSGDVFRRIKSGRLVRVLPGVYLVAAIGVDPTTFRRAALLTAGEEASLIHRSAGGVLGIIDHPVGVVHVGRPGKGRKGRLQSSIRLADGKFGYVDVARASDLADESEVVDGERRTRLPRTLVDLAEHAPILFESAWRESQYRNLFDVDAVRAQLEGTTRKGHGLVRRKLADMLETQTTYDVASPAEFEAIRMVLRAGAPPPLVNYPMVVCGRRRRLDLYWHYARLAVEIDGWDGHKTPESFEDDRVRDSDLLSIGIVTNRFTARRVSRHPNWCAGRILQQLVERGGPL